MEDYRQHAPSHQIYRFCPLCATALEDDHDQVNGRLRPTCPVCGWVYYPANLYGALAVVEIPYWGDQSGGGAGDSTAPAGRTAGHPRPGIVLIRPPGCPPDATAALPGGIAEYAETPEECATREVREETGLEVEVTDQLVHWLAMSEFGPMLQFGFTARVVGGALRTDGDEGPAGIYPLDALPGLSPGRVGSRRVLAAYLANRGADDQVTRR